MFSCSDFAEVRKQDMEITEVTEVLSPSFSEADSVSGLLDKENNTSNKINKLDIFNQVVQTFRLSRSRRYSTLGSCPNLARLSSKTVLLKETPAGDNGDNNNDKMLNLNTPYGTVRIFRTGGGYFAINFFKYY